MTNPQPPSPKRRLSLDELIAIIVAFLTVGALLFWGLTKRDGRFAFLNKFVNNDTPIMAIKPELEEVPEVIAEAEKEERVVPKVKVEEEEAEVEVETIPESLSLVPPLVAEEEATVKPVTPKDTETE
ncbi:MAG: hypothetical protein WA865_05335, partial [Spirulinaceae cyanobacterium]